MLREAGGHAGEAETASDDRDAHVARLALIAFVAIEVAAVPVLLYLGRDRWFRYDEWDFLASRRATNLHDLFEPHSVHWTTLPILVYRALWSVFGLRSYVPYQFVAVVTHLVVVALVRAVTRRAGVRPWTATAAASLLVLFGAGEENILWAFQICFTLSLAFGLAHLLLADHDGPVDHRDLLGLLCGFAGLLSSGVAVAMTVIVGLATLSRRGWRIAALHTVPLAVVYLVWYAAIGNDGYTGEKAGGPGAVLRFLRTAAAATFDGMAQVPGLGWLLAAFLIGGLALAWSGLPRSELRARAALPSALLLGALVFLLITGAGRAQELARATRFTHIAAVLAMPAIAVAADAVLRRWRFTAPILAIALVVGIVGNVRAFDQSEQADKFQRTYREYILTLPRLPIAADIPRAVHPDLRLTPWVTMGWLRDGVAADRIPAPDALDPIATATAELRLALARQVGHQPGTCAPLAGPANVRLAAGGSIKSPRAVRVTLTDASGTVSQPVSYDASVAPYLVAYAGPLDLHLEPAGDAAALEVCDRDGRRFEGFPGP